jgi:hypothetical protein
MLFAVTLFQQISLLRHPIEMTNSMTNGLNIGHYKSCKIGGHRWPPTYSTGSNYSFHLGSFSTVFRVPNFWGHFEALNDIFLTWKCPIDPFWMYWAIQNVYSSARPFQWVPAPKQRSYAKVVPSEVDVSTTPIGAHKPFGVSSLGVRVLDV